MLAQSHQEIMQLAERFTNEELFSKGVFDWVGNSPLGALFCEQYIKPLCVGIKSSRRIAKTARLGLTSGRASSILAVDSSCKNGLMADLFFARSSLDER